MTYNEWVKEFRVSSAYIKPTNYYQYNIWNIEYNHSPIQKIVNAITKKIKLW